MSLRIHHIVLSKAQLDAIPEQERNLFVLLGHCANEIGVLAKLFHFCAGANSDDPLLMKAENTQALLLGRLLTGKLYEFWNLLQVGYFGSAISRTYHERLDREANETLDRARRYFGGDNLIARVRNTHAFHYDVEQVAAGHRTLADGDVLDIFLAEANANSLYAFADTIAGRALLECIRPGDPKVAFDMLVEETSKAVGWLNVVTGALMAACIKAHLGRTLYELGAKVIEVEGAPYSQAVRIPYFIELPDPQDA